MVLTRVTPPQGKRSPTEGDFYADLDASKRRLGCGGCGGCLLGLSLLFLALGLSILAIVAATGAISVPFVSSLVYKEDPLPRRVVDVSTSTRLDSLLSQLKPTPTGQAGTIVTEAELTALLREPSDSGTVILKRGQVAIDASSAELFGQVTLPQVQRPVMLRVELTPLDQQTVTVTKLTVGNLTIPMTLVRLLVTRATGIDVTSSQALERFGITSLSLGSGTVTVIVDPAKLPLD
ncbi:hypothetical protein HY524_00495 [Candidatus Berkelbacteria bacterium]|nr:hypothetical protein [Candidatus Berkelbacteria bacterium]